jgi:pantoate--beta-alanine ligase
LGKRGYASIWANCNKMILFKKAAELEDYISNQRAKGVTVGFAPTMGALHAGHISLIETVKEHDGLRVCSIFVNPTQFNDPKDFEKYPVTIENDINILEKAGCDILFIPTVKEMYPGGLVSQQQYELGYLETILEGKFRPGHFQGVCQVVHRLLDIVQPDNLYLGQKDYQQCMVLTKLVKLLGRNINVIICPTLREKDGLAMSSRNLRLNEQERQLAVNIAQVLFTIKKEISTGSLSALKKNAAAYLTKQGFKVDYVEIADADTLALQENRDGNTRLIALVAAFLNEVRLIDNMLLN